MKKRLLTALLSIVAGSLNACSTANWYEGIQTSQKQACENQQGSARESCLEHLNRQSYEDYKASKEALKKEQ